MQFEQTITIQSTPEKIWDHLTNFEKAQEWNDCLNETKPMSAGAVRQGFQSRTLIKEGKTSVWYDEEIVRFAPYTTLKLKLTGKNLGKNPMLSEYQLKEGQEGTTLTQEITWQPSGILLKLLHKMIEKMSKKNIDGDLNKLKAHLES